MPVLNPDPSGNVIGSLTPDELAVIAAAQDAWADVYAHNQSLAAQIKAEAGKFKWTPRLQLLVAQVRTFSPSDANALARLYSDPALLKKYAAAVIKGISKGIGTTLATGASKAGQGAVALGPGLAHASQAISSSLNPIAGLFQASIWLRVAEVGLGLLLVAVGVAKLTNAIPAATKIATAVSKMPV